jgi:hypothetical protein
VRWHYRDGQLLWLFPPAFLAHVAEERWAGEGFPAWLGRIAGAPVPVSDFVIINAVGFVLLIAGVRAAVRSETAGWVAVAIGALVTVNGLLHLMGTIVTGAYSPGLITGFVLWLLLGMLTLLRAYHQVSTPRFAGGVAAGIGIHVVVSATAFALARS